MKPDGFDGWIILADGLEFRERRDINGVFTLLGPCSLCGEKVNSSTHIYDLSNLGEILSQEFVSEYHYCNIDKGAETPEDRIVSALKDLIAEVVWAGS